LNISDQHTDFDWLIEITQDAGPLFHVDITLLELGEPVGGLGFPMTPTVMRRIIRQFENALSAGAHHD